WDGVRAQIHVGRGDYRMCTRSRRDVTANYPEFEFLRSLPPGTVIDAEIVVMDGARPSFHRVMIRDRARRPASIKGLMATHPAKRVAFALLNDRGRCLMAQPLRDRRTRLREIVDRAGEPVFACSESMPGSPRAYFDEVCRRELEGIVLKRLDSKYRPGRRGAA